MMKELEKAKTKIILSGVKKVGVAYVKQKKAGVPVTEISVSQAEVWASDPPHSRHRLGDDGSETSSSEEESGSEGE